MKLPQLGDRVLVVLGDHRLTSRVEAVRGGDTVVLAPPAKDGVVVRPLVGESIAIEWTTGRGMFRGDGIVLAEPAADSSVLWVRLDSSQLAQRREHIRVELSLDVELTQVAGVPIAGTTIDVSGGGMRARVPLALVAGEHLDVTLSLPDEEAVSCEAEVIRGTEGTGYAFRFAVIDNADRERLIRFVFAEHRREFAVVRRSG
jgi:hypothetical protein